MTEYLWTSPGGLYVVPDSFKREFLAEFPSYRIRWSLKKHNWQVEQQIGRGALAPFRIDPDDDSLIRARDGYWLVFELSPGGRMPCPAVVERFPLQHCNWSVDVPIRTWKEARCTNCRLKGRDGRTIACHWPFDGSLLDHLRHTDPLRGGTERQRAETDRVNQALLKEAERKRADAMTSLDYVDYRWLSGIAASSGRRRKIDDTTFR